MNAIGKPSPSTRPEEAARVWWPLTLTGWLRRSLTSGGAFYLPAETFNPAERASTPQDTTLHQQKTPPDGSLNIPLIPLTVTGVNSSGHIRNATPHLQDMFDKTAGCPLTPGVIRIQPKTTFSQKKRPLHNSRPDLWVIFEKQSAKTQAFLH